MTRYTPWLSSNAAYCGKGRAGISLGVHGSSGEDDWRHALYRLMHNACFHACNYLQPHPQPHLHLHPHPHPAPRSLHPRQLTRGMMLRWSRQACMRISLCTWKWFSSLSLLRWYNLMATCSSNRAYREKTTE